MNMQKRIKSKTLQSYRLDTKENDSLKAIFNMSKAE
jgi:hypothetical protein